jgi:hypothetical protein
MKLIKRLKSYSEEDAKETIFGFGILRAKDYDKDIFGHLIFFSFNLGKIFILKKLFIGF